MKTLHKHKSKKKLEHERALSHIQSSAKSDLYISEIDRRCKNVAIGAVVVWICLGSIAYSIGYYTGRLERLTGVEQRAPMAASMLLGMSVVSSLLPMTYRWKKGQEMTGIITAGMIVQFVAFTTDFMLCALPVPVFIDPITGARVFALRWSEWTPLAFVMTFMTEVCRVDSGEMDRLANTQTNPLHGLVDVFSSSDRSHDDLSGTKDHKKSSKEVSSNYVDRVNIDTGPAYSLALCQALSTFCGFLFPHIKNMIAWIITMLISCALFLVMYYRLYKRYHLFQKMKIGSSISEQEMFHWARLSLGLLATCTALWSFLVFAYFVYSIGPLILTEQKFLHTRGIVMICECSIDVLFKSVYMLLIVDVHNAIFSPNERSQRRLEELREMMSIVWENSSDVIGLSIQKSTGGVTTLLSPTFLKLYAENLNYDDFSTDDNRDSYAENSIKKVNSKGAAFELDAKYFSLDSDLGKCDVSKIIPSCVYEVEFGKHVHSHVGGFSSGRVVPPPMSESKASKEDLGPISELVVKAWKTKNETNMILHDLVRMRNKQKETIRCEANITRLEENALVIVVRNISERFHRFEAEKKAVSELTARMKDAAANRFTRHEVKNGILAAIGLCDSLKDAIVKRADAQQHTEDHGKILLLELDKTLHEILDTILAEAMARDVIHEVYEPKKENVDVTQLIRSTMNSSVSQAAMERFPVVTEPSPLPNMALDPQLLKYIHRNAMSNACKYGKRGGMVTTEIKWDSKDSTLLMNVINQPGSNHAEIVKLGRAASEIIFSPSNRLQIHSINDIDDTSHSAGDGAWVMLKCAKTLGGNCKIEFFADRTIFSFRCPVTLSNDAKAKHSKLPEQFKLPANIYAIAIDDSKIQRRLLAKYFSFAGIPETRVRILGGTTEEIKGFNDWAFDFVTDHPDDFFLFIVDENLEVNDSDITATKEVTISGSKCVSKIRQKLGPEQESRILTLIRSANDSAEDVAIYSSRAHGYLPKVPIKPGAVLEELTPLWLDRFPSYGGDLRHVKSDNHIPDLCDTTELFKSESRDLIESVRAIDKMISNSIGNSASSWPLIWEKLHVLKGDILTLSNDDAAFVSIVETINSMRGAVTPPNLSEKWELVKAAVSTKLQPSFL